LISSFPEIKASAMPRAVMIDHHGQGTAASAYVSIKDLSGIVDIVVLSRYRPYYSERRAKSLSLIPGVRKRGVEGWVGERAGRVVQRFQAPGVFLKVASAGLRDVQSAGRGVLPTEG
jgi:hypothetical protein